MKAKLTVMFVCLLTLSGCDNGLSGQIDKCVEEIVDANISAKQVNAENEQQIKALRVSARLACLKAAGGKD